MCDCLGDARERAALLGRMQTMVKL